MNVAGAENLWTAGAWIQAALAAITCLWVLFRPPALCQPLTARGPLRLLQRRDAMMLGLCLLGLTAGLATLVPNFVARGYSIPTHVWDTYHYFMGAKYFPELGYTGLYECSVVADIQDGHGKDLHKRNIRNLTTNRVESSLAVASDPERCLRKFSAARWRSFKQDTAWFRAHLKPDEWLRLHVDHGFNGTPIWLLTGRALANLRPATTAWIWVLVLVDILLLVIMWLVLWRVFGWRAALVALIYWATNYTARLAWTNGAFLRQDWLVLVMLGVCALRRRRHALAGFSLTWAVGLRLFPALLLAGPLINALRRLWQRRRPYLSPEHRRLLLGSLAALVLLSGLSVAVFGAEVWPAFWRNIVQHEHTPAVNIVGLKAIAAYNPRAKKLINPNMRDGLEPWREARHRTYQQRRPVFLLLVAGFLLLLARAVWRRPDWESSLLSIGLIAVAGQAANYYFSIFLGLGLFYDRHPLPVAALCAYAAVSWLTVPLLPDMELRYMWLSALILVLVLGVTYYFATRPPGRDGEPGQPAESELQQ